MSLRTLAVIPAYNEALNIEKTVCDLRKNAPDVDFIVVNDGSRDNTLKFSKESASRILTHFAIWDCLVLFKPVLNMLCIMDTT